MYEDLMDRIVGSAIAVHRALGPRLPEAAYHECLARELRANEIAFVRNLELPIVFRHEATPWAHTIDFLVQDRVVVSALAVDRVQPSHGAHLSFLMQLVRAREGLLLNFHAPILTRGLKRRVARRERPPLDPRELI